MILRNFSFLFSLVLAGLLFYFFTVLEHHFSHALSQGDSTEKTKEVSLDDLLEKIKREGRVWGEENRRREKEFLKRKDHQETLLKKAQSELDRQNKVSQQLIKEYELNEQDLKVLEEKLEISKGTLGEVFGIFKQVIGDLQSQLDLSVVSAQIRGRSEALISRSKSTEIPTIEDIEFLWYELQREITESGKVVRFRSPVVNLKGGKKEEVITRVGGFNLVSNGRYLTYQSSTNQIVELSRQPSRKWTKLIRRLERGEKGEFLPFGVDPSRGGLLSLLIQTPTLGEYLRAGKVVGVIIILIFFIGLFIVIERMVVLKREEKRLLIQLQENKGSGEGKKVYLDNVLGRLIKIYEENKMSHFESLELKMEEEILKSRPSLERGISTLKILASIAPLLGLLGTVIGMILTFQSITLFGTGDPKLMAGGISQALVTTVLGLICAIFLTFLHSVVSEKNQNLLQILEQESLNMLSKSR